MNPENDISPPLNDTIIPSWVLYHQLRNILILDAICQLFFLLISILVFKSTKIFALLFFIHGLSFMLGGLLYLLNPSPRYELTKEGIRNYTIRKKGARYLPWDLVGKTETITMRFHIGGVRGSLSCYVFRNKQQPSILQHYDEFYFHYYTEDDSVILAPVTPETTRILKQKGFLREE